MNSTQWYGLILLLSHRLWQQFDSRFSNFKCPSIFLKLVKKKIKVYFIHSREARRLDPFTGIGINTYLTNEVNQGHSRFIYTCFKIP
jgi:hypothetical protein